MKKGKLMGIFAQFGSLASWGKVFPKGIWCQDSVSSLQQKISEMAAWGLSISGLWVVMAKKERIYQESGGEGARDKQTQVLIYSWPKNGGLGFKPGLPRQDGWATDIAMVREFRGGK